MEHNMNHQVFMVAVFVMLITVRLDATSEVYIVYMGEKKHDDPMLTEKEHYNLLSKVLGSDQVAQTSMIYTYTHSFSGFAARLTKPQAEKIAGWPGVVHVFPNGIHELHTTRSWDFLGLHAYSEGLLSDTHMGSETIIGVIDSGIWPESHSFSDKDMGPIPSSWNGTCQPGVRFNSSTCNKKLIGARWFREGIPDSAILPGEFLSARDAEGHGTHTASTAAGRLVENAKYGGLASGIARGGAPLARLAIYKACWARFGCSDINILKAFDMATKDGVHVISLSVGGSIPLVPHYGKYRAIDVGSFHAARMGVTVVCSAGNHGPSSTTVNNIAPWMITVAASSMDRSFPTAIILGNNKTVWGQSLYSVNIQAGFIDLVNWNDIALESRYTDKRDGCNGKPLNRILAAGKVVICFSIELNPNADRAAKDVSEAKGSGFIFSHSRDSVILLSYSIPIIEVDFEVGTEILSYMKKTSSPFVELRTPRTTIGEVTSPRIAYFSSRGPSALTPAVLKPDIAAPGVAILAAAPASFKDGFQILDGTSMATPHVAGVVALLKSVHPEWSPAAIKSAIVTTASQTDINGNKITSEGGTRKPADPFDMGGGNVNPTGAANPGLIYNMSDGDYVKYMCHLDYGQDSMAFRNSTEQLTECMKTKRDSLLDLNLPSICIPTLQRSITVTRTLTNVGPTRSVYKVKFESPEGLNMVVKPKKLKFNSRTKMLSFQVTFSSNQTTQGDYVSGSLTWFDRKHHVRIPVVVRHIKYEFYSED